MARSRMSQLGALNHKGQRNHYKECASYTLNPFGIKNFWFHIDFLFSKNDIGNLFRSRCLETFARGLYIRALRTNNQAV